MSTTSAIPINSQKCWQVLVVGGGHAGSEAALAAARLGCETLLITMKPDKIGHMPCNPAIGGIGKGALVKEIDALGGQMGKAADATGIQFRVLNRAKGAAVWGSRCQSDMIKYPQYIQQQIACQNRLTVCQAEVKNLLSENKKQPEVVGVELADGSIRHAKAVILTTGTFMEGITHIGSKQKAAGRANEAPSQGLSRSLKDLGLSLARLKTGTVPRLDKHSINWDVLEEQHGDDPICPFSFWHTPDSIQFLPQVCCHITRTNSQTHRVIKENLHLSALYSGAISGIGPRYCPSIEDKVVKFPDRNQHQVFLEPTTLTGNEIYPNGLSTSLPIEIQLAYLRTITGLEEVQILSPGYAVEYDFVQPTQLNASLAVKGIKALFLAGQLNGTTGYEEAAAQGLLAGINASLFVQGEKPFILGREESLIGVMLDDLVTKGVDEPYRMFTSRAEYRIHLREDNADLRLSQRGLDIGLLPSIHQAQLKEKISDIQTLSVTLSKKHITPTKVVNQALTLIKQPPINSPSTAAELIKRPQMHISDLANLFSQLNEPINLSPFSDATRQQVELQLKYQGYLKRQQNQVLALKKWQPIALPQHMPYYSISGLSTELAQKLSQQKPENLGQASRISGMTPVAIALLAGWLKSQKRKCKAS